MRGLIFRAFSAAVAFVVALGMFACARGCRLIRNAAHGVVRCAEHIDTRQLVDMFEGTVRLLGRQQLTSDRRLAGKRRCNDDYTGSYAAEYEGFTGREVVFGGASTSAKELRLSVDIVPAHGAARICVYNGADVSEYREGAEVTVKSEGGGCYIVVCCDGFTGSVLLTSEYE